MKYWIIIVTLLFTLPSQADDLTIAWEKQNLLVQYSLGFKLVDMSFKIKPNQTLKLKSFVIHNPQGDLMLTDGDKYSIQILNQKHLEKGSQVSERALRRAFHFIEEMIPANEFIDPVYTSDLQNMGIIQLMGRSYKSICHLKGRNHKGSFTAKGAVYTYLRMVGDIETGCFGRCGGSCRLLDNFPVYTQECFDHDLCHRLWGTQMGECKDELWKAAYGYLVAPEC